MAAAAAAALLDELMGRNRNVLPNEKPKELNWEDPEVSSSSDAKDISTKNFDLFFAENFSNAVLLTLYLDKIFFFCLPFPFKFPNNENVYDQIFQRIKFKKFAILENFLKLISKGITRMKKFNNNNY